MIVLTGFLDKLPSDGVWHAQAPPEYNLASSREESKQKAGRLNRQL